MAVMKLKYEKSVICWLGRHENTAFESITMAVFFFDLKLYFDCGMLASLVREAYEMASEESHFYSTFDS